VSLLEESDFGVKVSSGAARRTRVLVVTPDGDLESCSFIGQVGQLDRKCIGDWRCLMLDLCRKARSGMPLAPLFDSAWRELDAWQTPSGSGVMSVATFMLTRGGIAVLGFVIEGGDVVVVSCGKKGRGLPSQVNLTRCRGEAEAFCDAARRNIIEYLPRSMS